MPTETLREQFAAIQSEAEKLVSTIKTENRDYTEAEQKAQDERFASLNRIEKTIAEEMRFASRKLPAAISAAVDAVAKSDFAPAVAAVAGKSGFDHDAFSAGLADWAENGTISDKFATITTTSQSGIFMPHEVMAPIIGVSMNAFREAITVTGMGSMALITTTSTDTTKVPVLDAVAGGAVTETDSNENENPPGLTHSITLTPVTYESGSSWFSNLSLKALAYDLEAAVLPVLSYSKELGVEAAIVTQLKSDTNVTQTVLTSTSTASLTFANLCALNTALPKKYNVAKAIILGADAFAKAEAMVDTYGRPILLQDTQNQSLKRFAGTPVLRSDYFSAINTAKAGTNAAGCVISMLGFRLRDAGGEGVARYANIPARPAQTGFNLFSYHAWGWAADAVALLE